MIERGIMTLGVKLEEIVAELEVYGRFLDGIDTAKINTKTTDQLNMLNILTAKTACAASELSRAVERMYVRGSW